MYRTSNAVRIASVRLFLVLVALVALCGTAFAGVTPSPWHVVIANRTDRLDPASPFYNKSMFNMVVRVAIYEPLANQTAHAEFPVGPAGVVLAPGGTLAAEVPLNNAGWGPGAEVVSWTFAADLGVGPSPWRGIDPSPWRVFAFETKLSVPPDPYEPPSLAPAYLTGEMPILGFASPGVVVGTVAAVNDLLYEPCPSVPQAGYAWKNHGRYVRCVAHRAEALALSGQITTEDADAIVSAAAQSGVGKK